MLGTNLFVLYVGIRADERRDGYISTKPNITPVFPSGMPASTTMT